MATCPKIHVGCRLGQELFTLSLYKENISKTHKIPLLYVRKNTGLTLERHDIEVISFGVEMRRKRRYNLCENMLKDLKIFICVSEKITGHCLEDTYIFQSRIKRSLL
jgi:hypothetical protein